MPTLKNQAMPPSNSPPSAVAHHANASQDRLDGVAIFVSVVQAGSFARAAEQLGVTRSAIGKAIARVEARLATRLFHRTTRSLMLTDDGHIYYERCLRAMEELKSAELQIESGRREVSGVLRVSMPVLFGRHCVAPILLNFAKQHPNLELHLSFSDQTVDLLADGFDLVIRNGVLGQESSGLRARKLVGQPKVICASPDYLAQYGQPSDWADLTNHRILLYRRAGRIHTWQMLDDKGKAIDVPLHSSMNMDDMEAIVDAAVQGLGLAWVPEWLILKHLNNQTLTKVLTDHPSITMECHALWADTPHMPQRIRLAVDALVEALPQIIHPSAVPSPHADH